MKDVTKERDDAVGRLLGGALKARAAAQPAGACLDADTLAAWADETLSRSDRAAVEAHAADCARCQAMLAAMVRTLPVEPARASWMPALGWLIPATAVAAAVVVWMVVPQRTPVPPHESPAAAVDQIAAAPGPILDKPETLASQVAPERKSPTPAREPASTLDKPAVKLDAAAKDAALAKAAAAPDAARPTPPPPVAAPAPPAVAPPMPPAAPAAPNPAAAAAPASANTFAEFSARSRDAAAEKTTVRAAAIAPVIVVSPNPDIRWRIVPGGGVQHTTDSGATWQTQQTGVSVTLTAGASPSSSVCWLVGHGGVVTLSTDATTWRRTAFPETADLVSVTAIDGRTATVTLADGRKMTTTDAGASWR